LRQLASILVVLAAFVGVVATFPAIFFLAV
jgi:hypothetical protein